MKAFNIVLFIFILNLVCGLMYAISFPGTQYSNILGGTGNPEDVQERVDPGKFMNKTDPKATEALTFLGAVVNSVLAFWDVVRFTIFGFPTMMIGISGQINDAEAKLVFDAFAGVLVTVMYLIVTVWLFQLWSGRSVE